MRKFFLLTICKDIEYLDWLSPIWYQSFPPFCWLFAMQLCMDPLTMGSKELIFQLCKGSCRQIGFLAHLYQCFRILQSFYSVSIAGTFISAIIAQLFISADWFFKICLFCGARNEIILFCAKFGKSFSPRGKSCNEMWMRSQTMSGWLSQKLQRVRLLSQAITFSQIAIIKKIRNKMSLRALKKI